jgi:hypothetical protein
MDTKKLLYMLGHTSLAFASGILVGMWIGQQFPDVVKAFFAAPIAGLVAALLTLKIQYDRAAQEPNPVPPPVLGIEKPRSPEWPKVREEWLKDHPTCAACGARAKLQVHHLRPFHLFPALELDPSNFLTLCEQEGSDHHLEIGHNGDFQKYNENAVEDAEKMLAEKTK